MLLLFLVAVSGVVAFVAVVAVVVAVLLLVCAVLLLSDVVVGLRCCCGAGVVMPLVHAQYDSGGFRSSKCTTHFLMAYSSLNPNMSAAILAQT